MGKPGEFYQDDYVAGYFDENGRLVVCEEFGSDADFDRYAVQVMNGEGYYNSSGQYVSYSLDDVDDWDF